MLLYATSSKSHSNHSRPTLLPRSSLIAALRFVMAPAVYSVPCSLAFLPHRSLLLLKRHGNVLVVRLPGYFFYALQPSGFSLLFLKKQLFSDFFSFLRLVSRRFDVVYFYRLKLRGLGFRLERLASSLYRFFFATTNFIYFHVPPSIVFRGRKRRMIFLSHDLAILRNVFAQFLLLWELRPYMRRGLFFPRQIFIRKKGKQAF